VFYCDSHKLFLELYGHSLPVLGLAITSDIGLLISGGQDKTVKVWAMDFGDCRRTLKQHGEAVTSVVAVNDTHYFFTGSRDRSLKYWDGDTFELILQFDDIISEVVCMAVGTIGDMVFAGTADRQIKKFR
jgi:U3 small nucleolar RNA-associated protein 12